MKIIECEQGTPAWVAARIGRPTSSNFDAIVTKSGTPSKSADRYLAKLAAEWFLGQSLDEGRTQFMERGTAMEAEAVRFYEWERDTDTVPVGLCLTDDGRAGASPDRLVGDDGLVEVKCPSAEVHMSYLLGNPPGDYFVQQQGQLWVTGRAWVDLLCYHPTFPKVLVRSYPDAEFIETLAKYVGALCDKLDAAKAKLADAKAAHDAARAAREVVESENEPIFMA